MRGFVLLLLLFTVLVSVAPAQEVDLSQFENLKQRYLLALKDDPNNITIHPRDPSPSYSGMPRISKIITA